MSNTDWDDDDDDLDTPEPQQETGSDLLKKLRRAKRADEKRIQELTEQLEGYSKVQRERIVKEVLERKGVNPKAQRLVLKDLDDITEDSVNDWLSENGDLFGLTSQEEPENEKENLNALKGQDKLTQRGTTPNRSDDLAFRIENASEEELLEILANSQ
jgi:hypothetical protein